MTAQPTTPAVEDLPGRPQADGPVDAAELVLEDRFSIVPEWVLDADIGDCALRLYAVLLRYGNTTGARMPSRATLATRLHKKSVDTVDRALADLVHLGAVQVEHRWAGQQRLTNRYRIRTSRPGAHGPAPTSPPAPGPPGGRTDAAASVQLSRPSRTDAATRVAAARGGGRSDRGRVAARIGHDRESSTETPPPPPPTVTRPPRPGRPAGGGGGSQSGRPPQSTGARAGRAGSTENWQQRHQSLLTDCGIATAEDWDGYIAQVHQTRRAAGQSLARWSAAHLLTALDLAVRGRGWPAAHAPNGLLHVAADPATRSPARLAEAGPWWDPPDLARPAEPPDLSALEAELDAVGGLRVQLQRTAREQLTAERRPVTRASVITRAVDLLRNHSHT